MELKNTDLYRFGGWQAVLIGAVVIIVLGFITYRVIRRPIRRMIGMSEAYGVGGSIVLNLVRLVVWGVTIALLLDRCFGVDAAGIISALGVAGIAVSLGAQQTIANVIGGLIITFSRAYGPGDWITVGGHKESRVVDTDWRRTTLEDEDGIVYVVPNSEMVSSIVAKGNPFYVIVIPFALDVKAPNVEALLSDCEGALLESQQEHGMAYNNMRPKASVMSTDVSAIRAEVKIYVNRTYDTRTVLRAVSPALVNLLQERDVLAEFDLAAVQRKSNQIREGGEEA